MRTYRLNSEEHIQMLTALVLQLIQCVVSLSENMSNEKSADKAQSETMRKVIEFLILHFIHKPLLLISI